MSSCRPGFRRSFARRPALAATVERLEERCVLSVGSAPATWSDLSRTQAVAQLAGKQYVADELIVAIRSDAHASFNRETIAVAHGSAFAALVKQITPLGSA